MKISLVHFVIDPELGGGVAVKSAALGRALTRAGVQVRLITTDLGIRRHPPPDLPGVDLVILRARLGRFAVPHTSITGIRRLLRGCDAALIMNHWTMLGAMAAAAARRAGIPYAFSPCGALTIQGRSRLLKHGYQALAGRRLIRGAGVVLATTQLEARQFAVEGVPDDRIVVIPNGVDDQPGGDSAQAFRARHGLTTTGGPDPPFVLFMGRLNPVKGPDLLLEAFAGVVGDFPNWHLVMAGRDEGLAESLRSRARQLDLGERLHVLGHLPHEAAAGAFRAASLLAVPSRHEAMSQVALEAGAAGTPVLLTDACGFGEVEAAGGGRVVPAAVDGLRAGLAALLSRPEDLGPMGSRLRAFVANQYGWPTIAERYRQMFLEL